MKIFPYGITISDSDYLCLTNDLLDVEVWIQNAIDGKIASCKGRLLQEWQNRLLLDESVKTVPASEDALIGFIVNRPEYKNRVDREIVAALRENPSSPEEC